MTVVVLKFRETNMMEINHEGEGPWWDINWFEEYLVFLEV